MDVDDNSGNGNFNYVKPNLKGKNIMVSAAPPNTRATPWVKNYGPQSLDDIVVHRDIV